MPVCFSGEMRNSRGALTPAWPGLRNPFPARAALFQVRMRCRSEAGQPYMTTIVLEERSMRNSCRGQIWTGAGWATLLFSVVRGMIGQCVGGQRGLHKLLDALAALGVLNREGGGRPIAGRGSFYAA